MSTARGHRLVSKFAGAALAIMTLASGAPVAMAHDAVIGATPGDKEVVSAFPSALELEFSGLPKEGFNTVALSRDNGGTPEVLFTGDPTLDGNVVRIDVPDGLTVQPGEYRIGFQIVSSDGHATKGMTTFTYEPAGDTAVTEPLAESTAAPAGSEETTDVVSGEEGSSRRLVLAIVGLLVVAGAAVAAVGKYRKGQAN